MVMVAYVVKYADQVESLFSREVLKGYMHEQMGSSPGNDELDDLMAYLRTLVNVSESKDKAKAVSRPLSYQTFIPSNENSYGTYIPFE